ncbi:MAG: hypothetical protein LQ347_004487 [Umbilicaria vellea]|nr:MAG: hypothetical protein LQ347_004487 [Umbilicaria vellea]
MANKLILATFALFSLCFLQYSSASSLDLCPLNATDEIFASNVTWGEVLNHTILQINRPSYLRPDIGGALMPWVYTAVVIIVHIPVVVIRVVRWEAVQTWCMAATLLTIIVTVQAYVSTKFQAEKILTWTPLLLIIDAGSMAQVMFLLVEDKRLPNRFAKALFASKKAKDHALLNRMRSSDPHAGSYSLGVLRGAFRTDSFLEGHVVEEGRYELEPVGPTKHDNFDVGISEMVDRTEDHREPNLQDALKDSNIWIAVVALMLLIAVVVVQILGLARAVSANRASDEPMVSWCSPIFQPFGIAVLDGNCNLYCVEQSFNKGIGCIQLPGVRQKAWLKATVAGISLGLIFEAIDIGMLALVHGSARWRGVKMRRPWFTMFGGLAVLGVILICGINHVSSLPTGITERVWVVTKAGGPAIYTGVLESSGLRGAIRGWSDGVFESWHKLYFGGAGS